MIVGKLSLILLCLLAIANAGPYNITTGFWSEKLKYNTTFEAFAGYEQITKGRDPGTSYMFYQLYSCHMASVYKPNPSIPLFIWLQGGPGSSSAFGAHTEIGPIKIKNGEVSENDYSWNILGHTLFIDSPLNTGFSYSGDRTGDKQVSSTNEATDHLVNFLTNFYSTWPALLQSPLYITGESFAGHYIPVLARKLIEDRPVNVTVAGIAIGNGWTDPINQINFMDSYLWSVGVIDRGFRDTCNWFQTSAVLSIDNADYKKATEFFDFLTNNDTTPEAYMGNISMFNFRNYNGIDRSYAKFLEDNKKSFGVPDNITFIRGNPKIYTAFADDITRTVTRDLIRVLRNTRVLIYNGQNDVVVNTPGVMLYLNSLSWSGIKEWKKTPKQMWTIIDEIQGWSKVSGNLWFVLVNGAGHMVPTDKPVAALHMMSRFVYNNNDWKN